MKQYLKQNLLGVICCIAVIWRIETRSERAEIQRANNLQIDLQDRQKKTDTILKGQKIVIESNEKVIENLDTVKIRLTEKQ